MDGKCFISDKEKKAAPEYLKVCGEIEIKQNVKKTIYTSNVGEIEDGHFVDNILACKSGFALYFYIDGKTHDETHKKQNAMVCVTVKGVEIESDKCIIRYTKGGEEEFVYGKDIDDELDSKNDLVHSYVKEGNED